MSSQYGSPGPSHPLYPTVFTHHVSEDLESVFSLVDCLETQGNIVLCHTMQKWDAGKKVGSLYHFRKYLTPSAMHYLYKSQFRQKTKSCYLLWAWAAQSFLSSFDRDQIHLHGLVVGRMTYFPPYSHFPTDTSSHAYCYSRGKCSNDLHSLQSRSALLSSQSWVTLISYIFLWYEEHSTLNTSYGTDSCVDASLNITILTFSSLRSIIIYLS